MELHHKLRRDPSWHPKSCNICGQLGHQAAQCSTGTVNWKSMYGAEAFLLKRPVFWSEIEASLKSKKIDFELLEKSAREYAEAKRHGNLPSTTTGTSALPPSTGISDLPPGWATAKDANGKVYYWHKETKQVQWNKPKTDVAASNQPPAPVEGDIKNGMTEMVS